EETMRGDIASDLGGRWIGPLVASVVVSVALLVAADSHGFAADNVKLVVNVAAGGVTDSLARLIGHGLNKEWGTPVIVENIAGGNSIMAAQAVLRAKPDGHTLLVTADAP